MLTHHEGLNCTNEENRVSLAALRKRAWIAFRAKIDEQTADPVILGKLRTHFEERFRYDEAGVPRVWKPDDDIDGDVDNMMDLDKPDTPGPSNELIDSEYKICELVCPLMILLK